MKTKKSILVILVIYYFMIAAILYLGYKGKINLWLGPLQTIAGLAVFVGILILSQLVYSIRRIKSKLVTIVFLGIILFFLFLFLFVTLSEWTSLSDNIFGYLALVLSTVICMVLGLLYFRKYKNYEILEFKNKISLNALLISTAFTILFLTSYLMSYKSALLPGKGLFNGFGILVSLYIGIAICLWSLGSFLIVRIRK